MARSPLTRLRIFGRIFWELRVDNSEIYKRSLLLLIFYIAALYSLPISGLHSPLYPPNMLQVLLLKKKFFTGLNQILPSLQCNNLVCILIKQYWAGSPFLSLNVSPAICVVYQEQYRPANPETPPPHLHYHNPSSMHLSLCVQIQPDIGTTLQKPIEICRGMTYNRGLTPQLYWFPSHSTCLKLQQISSHYHMMPYPIIPVCVPRTYTKQCICTNKCAYFRLPLTQNWSVTECRCCFQSIHVMFVVRCLFTKLIDGFTK